jgi:demethylmenaquinone methyltransferase/2-methoxy-6-polyprenyl-1,4-benzoquinol methylase
LLRQAELEPGQWVLEPGCGTGRLTRLLAEAVGPRGRVLALDISPKMVAACRLRVGHLEQVEVIQTSLEIFWAPPASSDRVICYQVFPHFDDQAAALRRLAGFLRPDGIVVVAHFMGPDKVNEAHARPAR